MSDQRGSPAGTHSNFASGPLLVGHPEHAHHPRPHVTAGERRLVEQHQRVERIAVLRERVGHEPVVGGVGGGSKEVAVEPDLTGVVIRLVLVAGALGNLDDYFHIHGRSVRRAPRRRLAPAYSGGWWCGLISL